MYLYIGICAFPLNNIVLLTRGPDNPVHCGRGRVSKHALYFDLNRISSLCAGLWWSKSLTLGDNVVEHQATETMETSRFSHCDRSSFTIGLSEATTERSSIWQTAVWINTNIMSDKDLVLERRKKKTQLWFKWETTANHVFKYTFNIRWVCPKYCLLLTF